MNNTVLIAYDGSAQAARAIDYAARYLHASTAYILTVWEPIHRQAARAAGMGGMMQGDYTNTNQEDDPAWIEAKDICNEGVRLAQQAGFGSNTQGQAEASHAGDAAGASAGGAEPYLVESGTAIWSAIVDAAEELQVDMIVTGTRALTGWKSLLQSSVAEALVKNSGRPVLIVPPTDEDADED